VQTLTLPPIRLQRQILFPLEELTSLLGLTATVDPITQTLTLERDAVTITHKIGSTAFTVDGELVEVEAGSTIARDVIFVPLRLIAETFGYEVQWQNSTRTVELLSPDVNRR